MDTKGNIHMTPEEFAKLVDTKEKYEDMKKRIHNLMVGPIPDDAVPIDKLPDPHCEDCFGRGHITRIIENIRKVEPCHCVRRGDK